MSTRTNFTENDEGKPVVDADGDEVGIVAEVRGNRAFVEPDPGITDKIMAKLGWGDADEDTYELDQGDVETITDDEVRITRFEAP